MVDPRIDPPSALVFVASPQAQFTGRSSIVAAGPDPSDHLAYFLWLVGPGQGWCADASEAMGAYRRFMNPDVPMPAASQGAISITPTYQSGPDSIRQEM
jgi:hypothetical protein